MRVFAKRAGAHEGELRIKADPPVIVPIEDLVVPGTDWESTEQLIKQLLDSYRRTLAHQHHPLEEYRYVHTARKVVGVGSVGTRCYILLLVGRDDNDPLFLQVKEAQASVLERFVGRSEYTHHGERVVAGQRLMQGASDIFLGWQRIKGFDGVTRDYYVRQFHDWKGGNRRREHARAGRERSTPGSAERRSPAPTLAGATGSRSRRTSGKGEVFDEAIADFAAAYADQNERDYAAFVDALKLGPARRADRGVAVEGMPRVVVLERRVELREDDARDRFSRSARRGGRLLAVDRHR